MIYASKLLDDLQAAALPLWRGTVYRHMFGANPPDLRNTAGARWNDTDVPAIYTSLERETALAEADYYISLQPLRPKARRTLYTVAVSLGSVVGLTSPPTLDLLGITVDLIRGDDQSKCRVIGSAVNWLGHDGMLVPSARRDSGTNLVIFRQDLSIDQFRVIDEELIAADARN
jgi:RES domain-containing protein